MLSGGKGVRLLDNGHQRARTTSQARPRGKISACPAPIPPVPTRSLATSADSSERPPPPSTPSSPQSHGCGKAGSPKCRVTRHGASPPVGGSFGAGARSSRSVSPRAHCAATASSGRTPTHPTCVSSRSPTGRARGWPSSASRCTAASSSTRGSIATSGCPDAWCAETTGSCERRSSRSTNRSCASRSWRSTSTAISTSAVSCSTSRRTCHRCGARPGPTFRRSAPGSPGWSTAHPRPSWVGTRCFTTRRHQPSSAWPASSSARPALTTCCLVMPRSPPCAPPPPTRTPPRRRSSHSSTTRRSAPPLTAGPTARSSDRSSNG
ncbi:unannotated protein [freshwater metagenome]|uniref:Unannotated protein n=1 Tax=freshwater metagenome TaxID=449393 RepID=A0A6J7P9T9_9ZZZZ